MCSKEILTDFSTFHGRYVVEVLHSYDLKFDDIYLQNDDLRTIMKDLAERDDVCFYNLACKIHEENATLTDTLLKSIFDETEFLAMQELLAKEKEDLLVPTVHIIPNERPKVLPFERTIGNRALRHSTMGGVENFCLVYFRSKEDGSYVTRHPDYLNVFEKGVEICGHRYFLLGASNSQLKSHSYWFYRGKSADDVEQKRREFGDFSRITNVGKYVSRLGLWFTTSKATGVILQHTESQEEFNRLLEVKKTCVLRIDDIQRDRYCFTDGCGLISKGLARLIAQRLECYKQCDGGEIYPSAYQIRVAGCKGLVIIEPDSTLNQLYLKIRDSMIKFPSDHWNLEICDQSSAIPTQLNNQVIMILSDLGVPDQTFLQLQQRWFDDKEQPPKSQIDLHKNKIPLPVNECRYMFGCALESKLEPGQCFIRYEVLNPVGKSHNPPRFQNVTGPVLVTKNPCPYAGDMRRLEAIDLPELYCLKDVIVFSTSGDRPDFHKIAGSDLDGDQYFVYWGSEIGFNEMIEPLLYKSPPAPADEPPITGQQIVKFYYSMFGPTLYGEIYNLHAVVVDRNKENHQRRTCQELAIELANMFSFAIDAAKTGYAINRKRLTEIRKSVKENNRTEYPDFLRKGTAYESQSILGQLFRRAKEFFQSRPELFENDRQGASTQVRGRKKTYQGLQFYAKIRTKLNIPPEMIIQELETALREEVPSKTAIYDWCEKFRQENAESSDVFYDACNTIDEQY